VNARAPARHSAGHRGPRGARLPLGDRDRARGGERRRRRRRPLGSQIPARGRPSV